MNAQFAAELFKQALNSGMSEDAKKLRKDIDSMIADWARGGHAQAKFTPDTHIYTEKEIKEVMNSLVVDGFQVIENPFFNDKTFTIKWI